MASPENHATPAQESGGKPEKTKRQTILLAGIAGGVLVLCCLPTCGIGGVTLWMKGMVPGSPGSSAPTEAMARKAIEDSHREDFASGVLRLISVRKTDGQAMEVLGIKAYKLECDVEFEAAKSWRRFDPGAILANRPWILAHTNRDEVRLGERLRFKTEISFIKTENGWRPDGRPSLQLQ